MIPEFKIIHERRDRKGFNASDFARMAFDIYHDFKGTERTNPMTWNSTLKMGAGKGVELQMLKVLKDSEIVAEEWDQDKEETYEMERGGVKVRMKVDAIDKDGCPIEIKSINNKNSIDIKKYADAQPRSNYVGQLAIYMDYLNRDIGYLFVASVDGLSYFWITCRKVKEGIYECGKTVVDIGAEYARWATILNQEPDPFEVGRYKVPVAEIPWKEWLSQGKISKTDITNARNNHKVIGDPESWQILYSPYKDLILEAQGVQAGYSEEELAIINEATTGFTTWK